MTLELKRRTTTVLLFQGDDLDPISESARDAERAVKTAPPSRLGDAEGPAHESLKAFDDLMDEATDRALKVRLTALPRKAYRDLLHKHPVRMVQSEDGERVNDEDAGWGFNRETFGDDIVPACVDADQFASAEQRDEFLDALSDGDFTKLYSAAVTLNQSQGPDPKVRLSSHLAPTSDETSTSPERLA